MSTAGVGTQAAGAVAAAKEQADALTRSQQHVVQLSNQLQVLEAKNAEYTRQLAQLDQQIAHLKAELAGGHGVAPAAAVAPVPPVASGSAANPPAH